MSIAAPNISLSNSSTIESRFLRAAQTCWGVENNSVILLHAEGTQERSLRGQLQSLGLVVYIGTDCPNIGPSPVIVIDARAWQRADIRQTADAIRRRRPEVALCVVTGLLNTNAPSRLLNRPQFNDARAFLQAAGFGFFSIVGPSHVLSA